MATAARRVEAIISFSRNRNASILCWLRGANGRREDGRIEEIDVTVGLGIDTNVRAVRVGYSRRMSPPGRFEPFRESKTERLVNHTPKSKFKVLIHADEAVRPDSASRFTTRINICRSFRQTNETRSAAARIHSNADAAENVSSICHILFRKRGMS